MSEKLNFEKLRVYQAALILIDELYCASERWPQSERYGLTMQLRRASTSIALNLAEGSSRTKKDFAHFINISRGSAFEVIAILTIAHQRNYLSSNQHAHTRAQLTLILKSLHSLKSSLIPTSKTTNHEPRTPPDQ